MSTTTKKILRNEVSKSGVSKTLKQLSRFYTSLSASQKSKYYKKYKNLNKLVLKFGSKTKSMVEVEKKIIRRKPHLAKLLNKQLDVLIKHNQRNPRDNIRTYMSKNIMKDYIQDKAITNRLLNVSYGRECNADCAVNFILNSNQIYDLFHTDPSVMQASVALADAFFKSKNLATSSENTLMAGALLLQLILMGARTTQRGYGGDNLVVEIKKQKGKEKAKQKKLTPEPQFVPVPGRCMVVLPEPVDEDQPFKDALANLDLSFSSDSW